MVEGVVIVVMKVKLVSGFVSLNLVIVFIVCVSCIVLDM